MLAAEECTRLLEAVADDAGSAMRAHRGECVDRAFEAIKDVGLTVVNYLKRLVVIVPTGFADCHGATSAAALPRVQS